MKHLLTVIGCCLACLLSAQELTLDYPYNPDYENDGNVGVEDLLQLLAYFDMGFEVDDIVIDEVTLTQWLQTISQTLLNQQETIDSLYTVISGFDSPGFFPIDSIDSFLAYYNFVEGENVNESIEIDSPLVPLIFVVSNTLVNTYYKDAFLNLPTTNVTDGYTLAVLNSNYGYGNSGVAVGPLNSSINGNIVQVGSVRYFVFYQDSWYPSVD